MDKLLKRFESKLDLQLVHNEIQKNLKTFLQDSSFLFDETGNCFNLTIYERNDIEILLQDGNVASDTVLAPIHPPILTTYIYLVYRDTDDEKYLTIISMLLKLLENLQNVFCEREIQAIRNSMPLINKFSQNYIDSLKDFALIWRDHFLEENIPLLESFETAGIQPQWIFTVCKGDQTIKRERIAAHFSDAGYHVDTFDNLFTNTDIERLEIERMTQRLLEFIRVARTQNKKILLIDDGALLVQCLRNVQHLIDCLIEVTIVGIKRINQLDVISIPIYDLARSQLKKTITYPEIAESCVTRIRQLVPSEKFRGRAVLIIGYGTSGVHVANMFRSMGCSVTIVDNNIIRLIEASECGFRTFKNVLDAIEKTHPLLVVGCSGEISLQIKDFNALPNDCYVTAIATKDLSALRQKDLEYKIEPIPPIGKRYVKSNGDIFIQIGDGRSVNLYRSEAIPNKANDVFKTGILVAAIDLCKRYQSLPGGVYLQEPDEAILQSGLLDHYYDTYLSE